MDFPLKTPRTIARQLSHPTGLVGCLIARLMNRHNAAMNAFAVEQLDPQPRDRILEIGFGGGTALKPLIARAGFVAGVDRSRAMVSRAASLFFDAVQAGRAQFHEGHVESLPYPANSFGKIFTVNTVYFWKSLESGFSEIHRVLIPGGCLVVGFLPKDRMDRMGMPTDIFTTRAPEDVVATLKATGFVSVRIERPDPGTAWNVIVASR
jgi:arsenite methyltransferase